ncbi:hypothetical protein HMPREF9120_02425 [Neisseria sp. oral taxon 020 str. F0370]|nr:hypothetical protein HMPREF9120_02425 [Neisseria sp. oral taxon 020 str. F0370]
MAETAGEQGDAVPLGKPLGQIAEAVEIRLAGQRAEGGGDQDVHGKGRLKGGLHQPAVGVDRPVVDQAHQAVNDAEEIPQAGEADQRIEEKQGKLNHITQKHQQYRHADKAENRAPKGADQIGDVGRTDGVAHRVALGVGDNDADQRRQTGSKDGDDIQGVNQIKEIALFFAIGSVFQRVVHFCLL